MKKLSFWSQSHPRSARMIIAFCHILLITLGILSGIASYMEDIMIPVGIIYFMTMLFSLAYIFYPLRKIKEGVLKYSWNRRVKHDIVLVLSYPCILSSGVNHFAFQPTSTLDSHPQVRMMVAIPGGETKTMTKKEIRKDFIQTIKSHKTEIKAQLKALKAEWKEEKDKLLPLKIFLILGVIVLAVIAGAAIGALSCELSCSGQEGLAVIVALFGSIAIILLSVLAIRAIVKMGKEPKPKTNGKEIVRKSRQLRNLREKDLMAEAN